jgi:uncharacterized membrane protein YccC
VTVGAHTASLSRLDRLDPGRVALRRAARVTIASCLAFYPLRYLVGDPVSALYALFTAVSLGVLSVVDGPAAVRTRTYLAAIVAGVVLVTAGTMAAVNTATAAAGMLVLGFAVAYAGVGGPRIAGVANGLQLLYILPSFPPFAPDTLGQRLVGLVVGGLLLAAADRFVWPVPEPPAPGESLAGAADRIAAYAAALHPMLRSSGATPDPAVRAAAVDAATGLRLANIPVAQRPLGPGVRDRALLTAFAATRVAAGRLTAVADLLARPGSGPEPRIADLVEAVGAAFTAQAGALRSGAPVPAATSALDGALQRYLAERGRRLVDLGRSTADVRVGLAAVTVAEEARIAVLATDGFLGARPPDPAATPPMLWFLHASPIELVRHRLATHLTTRSVYLQNAVRLALGLAAARVVAGALDLSHGFWVLLATLSLMRTSAIAGRAVLPRAFAGTVAGAVVAAGVLALVGGDTRVYAWALPLVMLLAFAGGSVLGVAVGQAGFTLVVALLFAQVAPVQWQLAEVRVADVLIGGLIGAVIGAAVWPRGGGGEVRRLAAACLGAGATVVRDTTAHLARPAPIADGSADQLQRLAVLFEHAYIQYRIEPAGAPVPDWLVLLLVVRRMANYSAVLQVGHAGGSALPVELAGALETAANEVATAYAAAGEAIGAGAAPVAGAGTALEARLQAVPPVHGEQEAALRLVDGWAWLEGLADDLGRVEQACGSRR